jgi:hypothetical protein
MTILASTARSAHCAGSNFQVASAAITT